MREGLDGSVDGGEAVETGDADSWHGGAWCVSGAWQRTAGNSLYIQTTPHLVLLSSRQYHTAFQSFFELIYHCKTRWQADFLRDHLLEVIRLLINSHHNRRKVVLMNDAKCDRSSTAGLINFGGRLRTFCQLPRGEEWTRFRGLESVA